VLVSGVLGSMSSPLVGFGVDGQDQEFTDSPLPLYDGAPLADNDEPAFEFVADEAQFPAFREWSNKHEEELLAKKGDEEKRLDIVRDVAREVLKKMYTERVIRTEQAKERNKHTEDVYKEERDLLLSKGSDWERVVSLIDLSGSYSSGSKDRSRMREILIKLKH